MEKKVKKILSYKKRTLVLKLLKKGAPHFKSYQIVVCRKQARSKSRLMLLGKLDLAKNYHNSGGFDVLKLDKKRFCKLLITRRLLLRGEVLKYFVPEFFIPILQKNTPKFK